MAVLDKGTTIVLNAAIIAVYVVIGVIAPRGVNTVRDILSARQLG